MNAERLRKCMKAVRNAKKEEFVMYCWKQSCGSAACAVGHYIRANPRCGLKFIGSQVFDSEDRTAWDAVAPHFDISVSDAEYLFEDCGYPDDVTREQVAHRINDFINRQSATALT